MIYQKPRGTADWFGTPMEHYEALVDFLTTVARRYAFTPIQTPTFEHLELFNKSVGETSDIVTKELYAFTDKGGREIALRPEGTAGVVRAYVENKLYGNQTHPKKFFYTMNLFRYERPQGGRMREFHQFGVEMLGTANPLDDVEMLLMAHTIIQELGLPNVELHLNYLGTFAQRNAWMVALRDYFEPYRAELTADSQQRLAKNPLRILDDKVDGEKPFVKNAPKLAAFLDEAEVARFQTIIEALNTAGIPYTVDDTLVRGLDYYTGLVFEFVSTDPNLVGKATVLGGGRYGRLVAQTGGPDVEGIGFAVGIERLLIAINTANPAFFTTGRPLDVLITGDCADDDLTALLLAQTLRNNGFRVETWNGEHRRDRVAKLARQLAIPLIVFVGTNLEIEEATGIKTAATPETLVEIIHTKLATLTKED